ncbi:MAG: hypothetical protein KAV87_27070 [Desulfobacteraceae bacterium]|nr:hypothetical protein [Desulfobacteraceae bacterium]
MQLMSNEEIKAMVGTEFIYVFNDHAEIPAIIAAFDPAIGFTCLATSLIDSLGDDLSEVADDDGNLCIFSLSPEIHRVEISRGLTIIKCLGYCDSESPETFGKHGPMVNVPRCNFQEKT